ncbi:MAG TPA: hypothetical protein VH374_12405 [Polyangia bacterium]|nr:hypothetical protein [Polyangia bacterium]
MTGGGRARAALLACAALTIGTAGCTVGSGVGTATGNLYVFSCSCTTFDCAKSTDYGSVDTPKAFDLSPTFFAGEPIDDISRANIADNRLTLRMARNGNGVEVNDTLYFDIESTYEIARCIRGRTMGGVPQWDTTGGWCDWTGGQGGTALADHPRINIGPLMQMRSSLSLLYSCNYARVVGDGITGSWIEFQDFGNVPQPAIPAEMRDPISGDFKVDFGSRLRATFNLTFDDERRVSAMMTNLPIPMSEFEGQLSGDFDFILERGRAAQLFP